MQNPSDLILDDQRVVVTYVCCFNGIFLPIFEAQNLAALVGDFSKSLLSTAWVDYTDI